jgi:DNA-binding transcriptional LysR family regulator
MLPVPDATIDSIVPRTRMRFDDLDAIADAAAASLGLAWLPSWLIRKRISSGALVRVFPEMPPFITDVHAIWPETPYSPMRARVAIDALAGEVVKLSSSSSEPATIEDVD